MFRSNRSERSVGERSKNSKFSYVSPESIYGETSNEGKESASTYPCRSLSGSVHENGVEGVVLVVIQITGDPSAEWTAPPRSTHVQPGDISHDLIQQGEEERGNPAGLRQAPRERRSRERGRAAPRGRELMSTKLQQLGFTPSKADTSLFFYKKGNITIFVLVYVDDIIVASSSPDATTCLLKDLKLEFALKDLGDLHYFLDIEDKQVKDGILLTQEKYTTDILRRVGLEHCKPMSTPISTS